MPLEAPPARPFLDPAIAAPTAGLDGPTDDLVTEPTPLPPPAPRLDPALGSLLRLLLLGTLLVAAISVALLYVATEGLDGTLAAWQAVSTVFD